MITALAGLTVTAFALALYGLGTSDGEGVTRRGCMRLLVLTASGLSLLPDWLLAARASGDESGPTLHRPAGPSHDAKATPLLSRWARLGRIWREMSSHRKGQLGDPARAAEFDQLKVEMTEALDCLPAWPELRVVFEERWAHIHRERYVMATCYSMVPGGPLPARAEVEEQVAELGRLVTEGKLSSEAAAKAAGALAVQAEYLAELREAEDGPGGRRQWEVWNQLWKQYQGREIEAGPGAQLAGKRLAELTIDDLGLLAGPPEENEGIKGDSGGTGAAEGEATQ